MGEAGDALDAGEVFEDVVEAGHELFGLGESGQDINSRTVREFGFQRTV